MAKKAQKEEKKSVIKDFLVDHGGELVIKAFEGFVHNLTEKMMDVIVNFEKRILGTGVSYVFFMIGSIFISVAIIFLLYQYLGLSLGWSFMFIGLILVIWSYMIRKKYEKGD